MAVEDASTARGTPPHDRVKVRTVSHGWAGTIEPGPDHQPCAVDPTGAAQWPNLATARRWPHRSRPPCEAPKSVPRRWLRLRAGLAGCHGRRRRGPLQHGRCGVHNTHRQVQRWARLRWLRWWQITPAGAFAPRAVGGVAGRIARGRPKSTRRALYCGRVATAQIEPVVLSLFVQHPL